jgi:sugar O-acyltransferase (sialic acid O-acetyltransferase NeuD family)
LQKSKPNNKAIIIGYSGHSYVVLDILLRQHHTIVGYCDGVEKSYNPFNIKYLGKESDEQSLSILKENGFFVSIGDNCIRAKVLDKLTTLFQKAALNAIHDKAVCSDYVEWSSEGGILVAANATINPFVRIGKGVICNTSCSIDHECIIGSYAHIAPSAVLCGNVTIGNNSFIGANSVIKQGLTIGKNTIIGAGSTIINNVPDNVTVVGNPGRIIKSL